MMKTLSSDEIKDILFRQELNDSQSYYIDSGISIQSSINDTETNLIIDPFFKHRSTKWFNNQGNSFSQMKAPTGCIPSAALPTQAVITSESSLSNKPIPALKMSTLFLLLVSQSLVIGLSIQSTLNYYLALMIDNTLIMCEGLANSKYSQSLICIVLNISILCQTHQYYRFSKQRRHENTYIPRVLEGSLSKESFGNYIKTALGLNILSVVIVQVVLSIIMQYQNQTPLNGVGNCMDSFSAIDAAKTKHFLFILAALSTCIGILNIIVLVTLTVACTLMERSLINDVN